MTSNPALRSYVILTLILFAVPPSRQLSADSSTASPAAATTTKSPSGATTTTTSGLVAAHALEIRGAGASFPGEVYRIWMTDYRAFRRQHRNVTVQYNEVGSHKGKAMMAQTEPQTIDYAGSDSPLTEEEIIATPDLQMLPSMAGAIVIGFNLPGISSLNLSRELLVGIYNGTFRRWNHALFVLMNPAVSLPDKEIRVMARADKAGTTDVFTKALCSFDHNWFLRYGQFSSGLDTTFKPVHWNTSVISYYGRTTKGITGLLLSVLYSIGYLSTAHAKSAKINFASIRDMYGTFVYPTTMAVRRAMDGIEFDESYNPRPSGDEMPGSYPIFSYTFIIVRMSTMPDCERAVELYGYIRWFMSNEEARYDCIQLNMVPLKSAVILDILTILNQGWTCGTMRHNVHDMYNVQTRLENIKPMEKWKIAMVIIISAVVLLLLVLASYLVYQHMKINMAVYRHDWKIDLQDQELLTPKRTRLVRMLAKSGSSVSPGSEVSMHGLETEVNGSDNPEDKSIKIKTSSYRDQAVSVWPLSVTSNAGTFSFKTQKLMLWLRDSVVHHNVTQFHGLTVDAGRLCSVAELCSKGILRDIIRGNDYTLDDNFKFSLSCDVAAGMTFLHHIGVVHGHLSSAVCFIDSRWNVKISHWQYKVLSDAQGDDSFDTEYLTSISNLPVNRLSLAPEILNDVKFKPTKQCDIYSFSFLVAEIFMRSDPCKCSHIAAVHNLPGNGVKKDITRPILNESVPKKICSLLCQAWSNDPGERPSFGSMLKSLERAKPSTKSVLDCMMEAVDGYIATLEEKVGERTAELASAKANMETLLLKMLPVEVASSLACGEMVEPESFDSVTIFFSDIVGFTKLSSDSTPLEVVSMLNDLYTDFDHVIDQHDVYKVETIGDAYMVISGAPSRNGIEHASEIASMAIDLAVTSSRFIIRHRPDQRLQLRVGVHSGSAVAGVVGLKMPRYCLFGDTVNTASRMETTCVPMKIQLSEHTKRLLDKIGGFLVHERGLISVKGKGNMTTYWLLGREGSQQMPDEFLRDVNDKQD